MALEADIIKSEPLELPLKKSKLDEYAAYLYAASIDPLYIHAAMYEQWQRPPLAAFRPVPNLYPSPKDKIHKHHHRYKESPPVLQHPERVVPLSESERFERSFQPNVALAPPATPRIKHIKIEETSPSSPLVQQHHHHPEREPPELQNDQITSKIIHLKQEEESTRSSIVDSTVSVVQSTGVPQRYNSEIELSTDTDDSLSDISCNVGPTCPDEVQRVLEILVDVPRESKDKVVDIVKKLISEHSKTLKKVAQLQEKIAELTSVCNNDQPAEYDVTVTSSRTEVPTQDSPEEEEVTSDSPAIVTSCQETNTSNSTTEGGSKESTEDLPKEEEVKVKSESE